MDINQCESESLLNFELSSNIHKTHLLVDKNCMSYNSRSFIHPMKVYQGEFYQFRLNETSVFMRSCIRVVHTEVMDPQFEVGSFDVI